jgi:hypothetical protein
MADLKLLRAATLEPDRRSRGRDRWGALARPPAVHVQGGAFFPDPTLAYIDGASFGGSCLRVGWISAGLFVEIRSGGRHILTSPVLAVTTEQALSSIAH